MHSIHCLLCSGDAVLERQQAADLQLRSSIYQEIPQSQASELEEAATKYYCQQFFNYFGSAALLPHCLVMPVISLASLM